MHQEYIIQSVQRSTECYFEDFIALCNITNQHRQN